MGSPSVTSVGGSTAGTQMSAGWTNALQNFMGQTGNPTNFMSVSNNLLNGQPGDPNNYQSLLQGLRGQRVNAPQPGNSGTPVNPVNPILQIPDNGHGGSVTGGGGGGGGGGLQLSGMSFNGTPMQHQPNGVISLGGNNTKDSWGQDLGSMPNAPGGNWGTILNTINQQQNPKPISPYTSQFSTPTPQVPQYGPGPTGMVSNNGLMLGNQGYTPHAQQINTPFQQPNLDFSGISKDALNTILGVNPNINTTSGSANILGPYAQGVQGVLQNQQAKDIADLRARFSAGGGTSYGTPAAYAESAYRAQALPQTAAALGQLNAQERGLNLGDINAGLTQRGQNISGTSTGLNLQNDATFRQNDQVSQVAQILNQLGLTRDTANANNNLNAQAIDINRLLDSAKVNNSTQLTNQEQGNRFNLGSANVGIQGLGLSQSAQQNTLAQILQAIMQGYQTNTPANTNVVQPSNLPGIISGVGTLASMFV